MVKDRFLIKCVELGNGAWKTEIVGCVLADGTRIPLNGTEKVGNDEWTCKADSNGLVTLQQHINAVAKCGSRSVGKR